MEVAWAILAACAAMIVVWTIAHWLRSRVYSPARDEWNCHYGCCSDPVSSVWLDRQHFMDERQRKLDASQDVMTRVM